MSDEVKNRIVVTEGDKVTRIKTDKEIVDENDRLEKELKGESESEVKKTKAEEQDMSIMLVEENDRAVNIGVVGVGQAGGKISAEFYSRGYTAVAINTAMTDLKTVDMPERNKMMLDYALGGAGKSLEAGEEAIGEYEDEIISFMGDNFEDNDVLMLVVGGAGGTGSGSAELMVNLMTQLEKPVIVMYILPTNGEGATAKMNSITTLSKLAKLASTDVVSSLMVIDNAKVEQLYPGMSMANFWKTANSAIVEPLHLFNKLSAMSSAYTSLDAMDFVNVLIGASDCSIYGMIEIGDYMEEDSVAEAIMANIKNGLLASEFDVSQARSVGVIITGSKAVLEQVPALNLEYGFSILSKICSEGTRIFRGIYEVEEDHGDVIRVYSMFSGLGLPTSRIEKLKLESQAAMDALSEKEDARSSNMTIDMGKTAAISSTDALHKRIKNKKSAISKIKKNSKRVSDRRRK